MSTPTRTSQMLQTSETEIVRGFVIRIQGFKNRRVSQRDVGVVIDFLTNLHSFALPF